MKGFVSKPDAAESGGRRSADQGVAQRTRTSGCRKSRCASWRSKRIWLLREARVNGGGGARVGWAQRRPPAERRALA